jgi:hypothetical protein
MYWFRSAGCVCYIFLLKFSFDRKFPTFSFCQLEKLPTTLSAFPGIDQEDRPRKTVLSRARIFFEVGMSDRVGSRKRIPRSALTYPT